MSINACCYTGRRDIPVNVRTELKERLCNGVMYLYGRGVNRFYTGGALGFDALAASAVLRCRKERSGIQLVVAVPCRDQAARWYALRFPQRTVICKIK